MGIPQTSNTLPQEMAIIRRREAEIALKVIGASMTMLSFPDLQLPFVPFEELVKAVLPIIRNLNANAIFSFDPDETTPFFDHPDHNIAGKVAKFVGAAADVKHFLPESKALTKRPELYLWSSDEKRANTKLELSKKIRKKRNQYLVENYPSQFSAQNEDEWSTIFSAITKGKKKKHGERYVRVR